MTPADVQAELDAAIVLLKTTTVGYKNRNWKTPPAGSAWANALSGLAKTRTDIGTLIDPIPTPPPSAIFGIGKFNVQSFPLDPNASILKAALMATAQVQGHYVVCGVAQAGYDSTTPIIDFKTQEQQADVMVPVYPGVKHGSTYDKLLQIWGPNGDVFSLAQCADDCHSGFGATHITGPDPVTGVYWGEPRPNSTSAGRLPFGWFNAKDVLSKNYKTLTFCSPNLSHVTARYPADVTAGTNFTPTVPSLPTGIPLGSMWRLPAGTVIPQGLSLVEDYIAHCALIYGEVCRDIGSTKGYYGEDYINTVGNINGWSACSMPVEQMNGSLPYAHKLSSSFASLMATVECVTNVTP